ncbi:MULTISPECIES: TetR/AcrR family transcriptional regulator [unclassified Butyrivibrio]|jgi:AcrR family transcriptional regulator|uniref:TetR/AcrR family transcriptional regulator n=1 Tax=unclassified Butyrivibrio TaxID=2639466 RepID=UPI0003B4F0C9|nr:MULTISPECIES: TetR/AcrR family transcriptional regulator [unclassified Butyrivibrio]MDC7293275.1 TetR/AcrR family transcriptional regulator [Butyrivibrio sp. DSM 10294]
MPKTYSESEREQIILRLKKAANELMMQKGVKKATVDELVQLAGIPKGTFYLFYPCKEVLFFDAAQDFHVQVDEYISGGLMRIIREHHIDPSQDGAFAEVVDEIADVILGAMEITTSSCLKVLLEPEAMNLVLSKLPDDLLERHREQDKHMGAGILEQLAARKGLNVEAVVGSFSMILFGSMYKHVIGEENMRESMRMLIKGLVIQILA